MTLLNAELTKAELAAVKDAMLNTYIELADAGEDGRALKRAYGKVFKEKFPKHVESDDLDW